ncbi:MAG: hypothetical protein WC998_07885 [Candidatus Paceibacterota bacterium]|jgi:hypothetical protein
MMEKYDAAADFACIELSYRLLVLAIIIMIGVVNEFRGSSIEDVESNTRNTGTKER